MKRILLVTILMLLPCSAIGEETLIDQPRWAFEAKGGVFIPNLSDWTRYYGPRDVNEYGLSFARRVLRRIDIGVGADWVNAKGRSHEVYHGDQTGKTSYEILPVNVFAIFRGIWNDDQLLVPYAGGGWTRVHYVETVEPNTVSRGVVNGYHLRAGLQLSLDNLDPHAANMMYDFYGVTHTYFFLEAERMRAVESITNLDLGGTAYRAGLLFEF